MNWINILKRQEVAQTSQTGMAPIDIQKPFKRVKQDKKCYDEFVEIAERVKSSFPNSKKGRQNAKAAEGEYSTFYYDDFYIDVLINIADEGVFPDEIYCKIISEFKRVSNYSYDYHYSNVFKKYKLYFERSGPRFTISIENDGEHDDSDPASIIAVLCTDEFTEYRHHRLRKEFDNWSGFF